MLMQLVGQGGKQSPQPEHSEFKIEWFFLADPMIASIGQASMHKVQPMQNSSLIIAVDSRSVCFISLASGIIVAFVNSARAWMTFAPPGAQRFISARDTDIASA